MVHFNLQTNRTKLLDGITKAIIFVRSRKEYYMAGTGTNADYEELESFASHLKSVIEKLNDIQSSTNSKLSSLHWDDVVFKKFEEQYRDGIRPFKNLEETLEAFIKFLHEKAGILRDFHR